MTTHPTYLADLIGSGLAPREALREVSAMRRVAAGSYALTDGLTIEAVHRVRAEAVLHRLSNVAASHTTAAVIWELPVLARHLEFVHVSRFPPRVARPTSHRGYRMHSPLVARDDIVTRDGVLTTDCLRTVLDCGRLLATDWAVVIADAALHRGEISSEALAEGAAAVARLKGASQVRRLPASTSALSESPGESLLRLRLLALGLNVEEQFVLTDVEGAPRVDFLVDARLVVEFDGRAKYSIGDDPERAMWLEKRRHDRLVEAGYEVLRITWDQLGDNAAIGRRINAALNRLTRRGLRVSA